MEQNEVIEKTVQFVKEELAGAEGGHDWWHIRRVWKLAQKISETEEVDTFVVQLGALLHDIADSKFNDGDETVGPRKAREFLSSLGVEQAVIEHVEKVISNISFKGGNHEQAFKSPELDVIQDADRLDAIGAIGIARAFNYGGFKGQEFYNPEIKPKFNMTKGRIQKSKATYNQPLLRKTALAKGQNEHSDGQKNGNTAARIHGEISGSFYKDGRDA